MKRCLGIIIIMAAIVSSRAEQPHQNIVDDAWQGAHGFHFSGRLTELRPAPGKDCGRLEALYRNTRLLLTSGEEGAVTWRVAGNEWSLRADDQGYWELAASQLLNLDPGWYDIESEPAPSSRAGFLVADPRNTIGLISDIDDTILVSEVLSKSALLKNSLTVPAEQRDAVKGMAALYARVLTANFSPEASAVFYLSYTPRQLTDNLRRFLQVNHFPRGVLQLREVASENGDSIQDHESYKLRRVEAILAAFPQTRFQLFGDDTERDPEIYAEIQAKHPKQVAGIWIRRINPDAQRPLLPGQSDIRQLMAGHESVPDSAAHQDGRKMD
jgi:phosphatidate phosphatase APP1